MNHQNKKWWKQEESIHKDQYDSDYGNNEESAQENQYKPDRDNRGTTQEKTSEKEDSSDNQSYKDNGMFSDKDYEGFTLYKTWPVTYDKAGGIWIHCWGINEQEITTKYLWHKELALTDR